MNTVIFLGAGASREDGAPLQSEILNKFFTREMRNKLGESEERLLKRYFDEMFSLDITAPDSNTIKFPTFEEAIGVLDLAIIRDETFKGFDIQQIRKIRHYLINLMILVIRDELGSKPDNCHRQLVQNLLDDGVINETFFVSTNYDILIDNALENLPGYAPDYGIDFINRRHRHCSRSNRSLKLYKLHGSLNWLYCQTCNTIKLTPLEKAATHPNTCDICNSGFSAIIVPPTYFKNLTNAYLGMIWVKAEAALKNARHLIFCGYSFPDADIHIKYLIKRAQNFWNDLFITVINNHAGKEEEIKKEEKNRFERFLGKKVRYEDVGFERFASNPKDYWNACKHIGNR